MEYKEICSKFEIVYLLDNYFHEIEPGINVYGTTLRSGNYGFPMSIKNELNDFNMIAIKPRDNTKYIF